MTNIEICKHFVLVKGVSGRARRLPGPEEWDFEKFVIGSSPVANIWLSSRNPASGRDLRSAAWTLYVQPDSGQRRRGPFVEILSLTFLVGAHRNDDFTMQEIETTIEQTKSLKEKMYISILHLFLGSYDVVKPPWYQGDRTNIENFWVLSQSCK